ncbi:hypothetical protein T265_15155, partial [Opisthorchis viverrini]
MDAPALHQTEFPDGLVTSGAEDLAEIASSDEESTVAAIQGDEQQYEADNEEENMFQPSLADIFRDWMILTNAPFSTRKVPVQRRLLGSVYIHLEGTGIGTPGFQVVHKMKTWSCKNIWKGTDVDQKQQWSLDGAFRNSNRDRRWRRVPNCKSSAGFDVPKLHPGLWRAEVAYKQVKWYLEEICSGPLIRPDIIGSGFAYLEWGISR